MHERRMYQLLDFLAESSVALSTETFREIFGNSNSSLWDKFVSSHGDLLKFWMSLDVKHKCRLAHYMQKELTHELI